MAEQILNLHKNITVYLMEQQTQQQLKRAKRYLYLSYFPHQ